MLLLGGDGRINRINVIFIPKKPREKLKAQGKHREFYL